MAVVVGGIQRAQRDHGPDAVGVFGGGGLTNEKAYTLGKFARVALRTSAIDYNGRFCMSSSATAGNRAFGMDRGLPFPLADIADAAAILLWGPIPRTPCHRQCSTSTRDDPPARSSSWSTHAAAPRLMVPPYTFRRYRAPTWHWPTDCCTSPFATG